MALSLDALSTELLLKIFEYLDIYDMCRLRQTCRRFNEIIGQWGHYLNKNVKPLVTNQVHQVIINRSKRLLSHFERVRISRNWKKGIYRERAVLYSKTKYIPWLQLEKDVLFLSRGNSIQAFARTDKGIDAKNVIYTIKGSAHAEVCRFIKKDNFILSGQTDGSLRLWSLDSNSFIFNLSNCHEADVNSVDMRNDVIVSGSRDNFVKIWSSPEAEPAVLQKINLHDRVWSVVLSEHNKSLLAIGTSGISDRHTITIYDLNHESPLTKLNPEILGAGVLDMTWENGSTLWSCGYDSYLRRWDLRTDKCEQTLIDPCAATVYCFKYDFYNSIISGTHSNGRSVLWDIRQKNYIQMYFMGCCRQRDKSSPVYSLSYDAELLFAVTDQYVNVLDFSITNGKLRDYSNLFLL